MVFKINLLNKLKNLFPVKSDIIKSNTILKPTHTDDQLASAKLIYNSLNANKILDNNAHGFIHTNANENQEHINDLLDNYMYFITKYIENGGKLTPLLKKNSTYPSASKIEYRLSFDDRPLYNYEITQSGANSETVVTGTQGRAMFSFDTSDPSNTWTFTSEETELFAPATLVVTDPFA